MQPPQIFKTGGLQSCLFERLFLKTVFSDVFLLVLIDLKATATLRLFCLALFHSDSVCRALLLHWHWYPCYVGHVSSALRAKDENEKKKKRKFAVQGPCSFKASAYRKARNVKSECINPSKLYEVSNWTFIALLCVISVCFMFFCCKTHKGATYYTKRNWTFTFLVKLQAYRT